MGLRMVAASSSVDLSAIEQQVADAKAVAEQAVSDAAAADAKAANARTMILNRDGTLATLSQTAAQFGSVTAAADATHQQLQNEITALQQQVASVATTPGPKGDAGPQGLRGPSGVDGVQGPAGQTGATGATGSAGAKGDAGPAGTPADMSRVAALETAVTALQALKVTVGYGVANLPASLAAGASGPVTVTLSRNMGSATYSVGYGLSGGTTLLGNVVCTGVTAQTATTVTLGVRNNGLASVLNLNAATLSVVAARDA